MKITKESLIKQFGFSDNEYLVYLPISKWLQLGVGTDFMSVDLFISNTGNILEGVSLLGFKWDGSIEELHKIHNRLTGKDIPQIKPEVKEELETGFVNQREKVHQNANNIIKNDSRLNRLEKQIHAIKKALAQLNNL